MSKNFEYSNKEWIGLHFIYGKSPLSMNLSIICSSIVISMPTSTSSSTAARAELIEHYFL
ncbi:9103_t:CDS:2 [Entrophospora sp. SA101]|nr:9103_t:CDS:2 [Entrophospora sp. SA101]